MAKLYAELSSDKGGRIASKSADKTMKIELKDGNTVFATLFYSVGDRLGTALEVYSKEDGHTIIK